jgi:serine phosphatase RsbU (regulator of sigma subunit)
MSPHRVILCCALLTAQLGVLTLIGWTTGLESLASLRRDYIPMAPSTALGFSILGAVMALQTTHRVRNSMTGVLIVAVAFVAGGKLIEFFGGASLGWDEMLVADPTLFGAVRKGRMSPITALNFLLTCFALVALTRPSWRRWASRAAAVVLGISFLVLLGYLHGTPLLYGGHIIPVALPTAAAFVLLAVGIIVAVGPEAWPLKPLAGDSARAVLLRWFLPMVVGVALLDGFLRTRFLTDEKFNPALSSALSTLAYTLVVTALISQVARIVGGRIDRAERERYVAQAELEALNRTLERRIDDRTKELQKKNQQIQEEMTMARELQFALLPQSFPSIPRSVSPPESALQFFSFYYPAGTVSGDFFSVFPVSETRVGIFICDVMGHGVRAALVTSMMRALLEQHSGIESDPGKLLVQINHGLVSILKNTGTTLYATGVMMIADAEKQELVFANAGHPKPLHIRRGCNDTVPLAGTGRGPALGLFAEATYGTMRTSIAPGDMIMLFTDGLFEVEGRDGELYTHENLLEAVHQRSSLPSQQLFEQVLAEVRAFAAQPDFEDDVCVIGVEIARKIEHTNGVEPQDLVEVTA